LNVQFLLDKFRLSLLDSINKCVLDSKKDFNRTVARDFDANFFMPIDWPDYGDGLLRGINFGRWACAEKRAFFAFSRMIKRGMNARFRYKIALAVGVNLHPQVEQLLYLCLNEKNARKLVFTIVVI